MGISSDDDKKKAIDKMISYFAAQELPPATYRAIDAFLTKDDVAAAWGKGDTDDNIRFDLWNNWAAAKSLPQPLPIDTALPAAPSDPLGAARMNRLARALTPS